MSKALIKLAYKQVIDSTSTGSVEQKIFHDSYNEFLLKSQAYNLEKKFTTFTEIVANDGRANSLHYKLSFAVLHHIDKLNKRIPGLQDEAGGANIAFDVPEFKLLESSIVDRSAHKIVIIYTTGFFGLLESFGEYLLLTSTDISTKGSDEPVASFVIKMQPGLSITSYKEIVTEKNSILP